MKDKKKRRCCRYVKPSENNNGGRMGGRKRVNAFSKIVLTIQRSTAFTPIVAKDTWTYV